MKQDLEGPIPEEWRPTLTAVVDSIVRGDALTGSGIPGVAPATAELSEQCRRALAELEGETLVSLPNETWDFSVAAWTGHHWDCLVDLWTTPGGRSDLVLHVEVTEATTGYVFTVHLVYVP